MGILVDITRTISRNTHVRRHRSDGQRPAITLVIWGVDYPYITPTYYTVVYYPNIEYSIVLPQYII